MDARAHTHARTHARTHAHAHAHTRTCTHANACTHTLVLMHNDWSPSTYRPTHMHTYVHTSTQHLLSSMLFISLPSASILGLPCTAMIISQNLLKASSVHVRRRQSCKIWFCCVLSKIISMWCKTPSEIMYSWLSSNTIALASTAAMNWARKWFRTSSAAQTGKSCNTHTSRQHTLSLPILHGSSTHFQ